MIGVSLKFLALIVVALFGEVIPNNLVWLIAVIVLSCLAAFVYMDRGKRQQIDQVAISESRDTSLIEPTKSTAIDTSELRAVLEERFSSEEIKTLCFDLQIDYEILEGEGKSAKARELIRYLDRRDELDLLVNAIRKERGPII